MIDKLYCTICKQKRRKYQLINAFKNRKKTKQYYRCFKCNRARSKKYYDGKRKRTPEVIYFNQLKWLAKKLGYEIKKIELVQQ